MMTRVFIWTVAAILLMAGAAGAGDFTLTSPDFKDGARMDHEQVFRGFGCNGPNVSPELAWTDPPEGTKSFGLMVHDPDAPTGSGWWHWVIFNIPVNETGLKKNAGNPDLDVPLAPRGTVQSRTDYGRYGYGGPCPPKGHGDHRYIFTLFALDVPRLDLNRGAMPAMVGFNLNSHALGKAVLTGAYSR